MTLLFPIMTLLYHLFFCKCPDYYFSLFQLLQKDYYFTYDTSIISLICFRIDYSYYCYYHTIVSIIFISNYYSYYHFRSILLQLYVTVYIMAIMAIMSIYKFKLFDFKLNQVAPLVATSEVSVFVGLKRRRTKQVFVLTSGKQYGII